MQTTASSKKSPVYRSLLKSNVNCLRPTPGDLHYEGCCAIDEDLLDAAGIAEHERVHLWNVGTGERFVTHAIKGQRGTGLISLDGSAAHGAALGDLLIIAALADATPAYARAQPRLVFVHEGKHRSAANDGAAVGQS